MIENIKYNIFFETPTCQLQCFFLKLLHDNHSESRAYTHEGRANEGPKGGTLRSVARARESRPWPSEEGP